MLEKTLESPLDWKEIQLVHPKGAQSWVFIGRTDLELKFQYFGHLMRRADSLEKTLMLGKIEGKRRKGWQRMRWLDGIIDTMDMNLSKLQEMERDREASLLQPMGSQRVRHDSVTEQEPFLRKWHYTTTRRNSNLKDYFGRIDIFQFSWLTIYYIHFWLISVPGPRTERQENLKA